VGNIFAVSYFKSRKTQIYNIILCIILYDCEKWHCTAGEYILQVGLFDNEVLIQIFLDQTVQRDMNETVGSSRYGRYKKSHNNEIFNLEENASETGKPVSILDEINA
jgi:hypothetical protein